MLHQSSRPDATQIDRHGAQGRSRALKGALGRSRALKGAQGQSSRAAPDAVLLAFTSLLLHATKDYKKTTQHAQATATEM